MSITFREKQLIQNSFTKVEPIAEQAAEIFYAKLFEYDPSLRKLFKSNLKDQGRKLMATLKVAVKGLDDLDALVPVLQDLAKRHIAYGVSVDDYTPVGNALLFTLKTGLGEAFDKPTREAWVKVYTLIATVMRQASYPNYNPEHYKNHKHYNH